MPTPTRRALARGALARGAFTRRALAAGTALLLLSGAALAQAPIVIKFSHVVAPDTPKGRGADKFKELAESTPTAR